MTAYTTRTSRSLRQSCARALLLAPALGLVVLTWFGTARMMGESGQALRCAAASSRAAPVQSDLGVWHSSAGGQRRLTARCGTWSARATPEGIAPINASHRIPFGALMAAIGMQQDTVFALARSQATGSPVVAGVITALILLLLGALLVSVAQIRKRQISLARDRAALTAINVQMAAAMARANAKSAQLQATLEGISEGVAMIDPELRLVEWNSRLPEVAGIPAAMLRVGLPIEDILRAQARDGQFGPVDVEEEVARRLRRLHTDEALETVERVRPDGHTIELRRNRLPDGGMVTLYSDVTARKRAEDTLRQARALAEAATEAKSRFVAMVGHEIRTPLNALLATLALLRDNKPAAAEGGLIEQALQSGEALLGLINDILELSRTEAEQLQLRPTTFALRPLLVGVIAMFRHQAAERGITLRLSTEANAPQKPLYADPGRLRQVLINMMSNAVKFSRGGIVELSAQGEENPRGQPVLYLAVRDPGPAIEPQSRAHLFRPFSQLDTTDPRFGSRGSGLGLAICRQIVALMDGETGYTPCVAADGQDGNEFWVRIPLMQAPTEPEIAECDTPLMRRILPRTRILLVEDVPANRRVIATMLRRAGHMVDIAPNGEAALRLVRQAPYDLVLTDCYMAGMSGLDVVRQIRAMPAPAGNVPIVAHTAGMSTGDQRACEQAGLDWIVAKPVTITDFTAVIAKVVWRGLPARSVVTHIAPRETDGSGPILSRRRLDELRTILPRAALQAMVEECLNDLRTQLVDLKLGLAAEDDAAVVGSVHAMIGMAGGYGMVALNGRLRAVMHSARSGDRPTTTLLVAELETELETTATALREALIPEAV